MSSAICQASTTTGKKCSRTISTKKNEDPHFCWQHQGTVPTHVPAPVLVSIPTPVLTQNTSQKPYETHTFSMTSNQMLAGDIGYAYDADFKTKKVKVQWDSLDDLASVLKPIQKGDWIFELYGDLNKVEDNAWVLLYAKGANLKNCDWTEAGEASTDAAMIGFFDNKKVRELSGSELQTMAEDGSSYNTFPFGVYFSTGSDGGYDVEVCKDKKTGEIVGVRTVIMAEEDFNFDL